MVVRKLYAIKSTIKTIIKLPNRINYQDNLFLTPKSIGKKIFLMSTQLEEGQIKEIFQIQKILAGSI